MKIENNGLNPYSRNQVEAIRQAEKELHAGDPARAESLAGKDQAILSQKAKLLAKARIAMEEQPEIRQDVVDNVRNRIYTGAYEVRAEALAEKLKSSIRLRI